jgi:hypothetical protein
VARAWAFVKVHQVVVSNGRMHCHWSWLIMVIGMHRWWEGLGRSIWHR